MSHIDLNGDKGCNSWVASEACVPGICASFVSFAAAHAPPSTDLYLARFYTNIARDMPILTDDDLITWLGYRGVSKRSSFATMAASTDRHAARFAQLSHGEYMTVRSRFTAACAQHQPISLSSFGGGLDMRHNVTTDEIAAMYPVGNSQISPRKLLLIYPSLLDEIITRSRTERAATIRASRDLMIKLVNMYKAPLINQPEEKKGATTASKSMDNCPINELARLAQENTQLRAENVELRALNADLTSQLTITTSAMTSFKQRLDAIGSQPRA